MHHSRRRSVAALVAVVAGTVALTGCSSHEDAVPEDHGQQWMSQMSADLAGDFGGGGGRLTLGDDTPGKATASIALEQDLEGPYDVLAVCRSTKTVHLSVRAFTTSPDGSGASLDAEEGLGAADIHCGATTRVPIDVPKGRDGIAIDASTSDRSGRALFDSFIVARGDKA